jgi:site-specific recombinase XerD
VANGRLIVPKVDVSPRAFTLYIERVRTKATAEKYGPAVLQFLKTVKDNGYEDFASLPRGILSRYVEVLASQNYSAGSIHVYVTAVKRYLSWVQDQGIKVADIGKPDLPKVTTRVRDALSTDQIRAFFMAATELEEPARTAVLLLPCTGLRANEMVTLPLSSIRKVQIQLKGRTKTTFAFVVRGKGGKERIVPLLDEGVPVLTGYLAGYRRTRKGPWMFPGVRTNKNKKDSHSLATRTLRYAVSQVRQPLGVRFTPHTMRRTYATALYRRGVSPATLAKILGHANIQTLYKHYLAIDEQDVLREVHRAQEG